MKIPPASTSDPQMGPSFIGTHASYDRIDVEKR
jgi:hypothetical protein